MKISEKIIHILEKYIKLEVITSENKSQEI